MRRALSALCAALALGGCATDDASIIAGGRVASTTLTVYSVLPHGGDRAAAARDLVLGQKLALAQAGGRAGDHVVNFVSADLPPDGRRRVADAVREVIRDPGIAAVIGDLTWDTARVSVPLYDAAGVLHVSPGVSYPGFVEPVGRADPAAPERYRPTGSRSFDPLAGVDEARALAAAARGDVAVETTAGPPERVLAARLRRRLGRTVGTARADTVVVVARRPEEAAGIVEAVLRENRRARVLLPEALWATSLPERLDGRARAAFVTTAGAPEPRFATAFRATYGRAPGPWAQRGYDAMRAVLAAVARAGSRASVRQALIDAYFADPPPPPRPVIARRNGGRVDTEPVRPVRR